MRIAQRGRPIKTKLKEQIVELYDAGLSDYDIAIKLSMKRSNVNYHRRSFIEKENLST